MTIVSRAYLVAGAPLWAVPLVVVPLAALVAVTTERRIATLILAVAFGALLKGEWVLYRYGWVCPWCTLGTVGTGIGALLAWGTGRVRPPLAAWGVSLVALGLPLAILRPPDAPIRSPRAFPLAIDDAEAIDRGKLTHSAPLDRGVAVFVGDPQTPKAQRIVPPWAKERLQRGWRLVFLSLPERQLPVVPTASRLLGAAWQDGRPGWEALFDTSGDEAKIEALVKTHGWRDPDPFKKDDPSETELRLMGFRRGVPSRLDCPPNGACHFVGPADRPSMVH